MGEISQVDLPPNTGDPLSRYSQLLDKNPREVVLLRGRGCAWKACRFCDYHLDASADEEANWQLNQAVLARVTGQLGQLEVLNSGSFLELDERTQARVWSLCQEKGIEQLHVELHWLYRRQAEALRARAKQAGLRLKIKLGLETFDADFRQKVLKKGIPDVPIEEIRQLADEICLLFGLRGQTLESMRRDVELGLAHFERVCINLMVENSSPLRPDEDVRQLFINELYEALLPNERVDILLHNQDFGIG